MLREPGLHILRSAGFACATGTAVAMVFRSLTWIGGDVLAAAGPGVGHRRFLHENLPQAEPFGWVIGTLLFGAFMLTPLPARYRRTMSLGRAGLLALAATLPLHFLAEALTATAPRLVWLLVALPLFVALVLRDWQQSARERPPRPD